MPTIGLPTSDKSAAVMPSTDLPGDKSATDVPSAVPKTTILDKFLVVFVLTFLCLYLYRYGVSSLYTNLCYYICHAYILFVCTLTLICAHIIMYDTLLRQVQAKAMDPETGTMTWQVKPSANGMNAMSKRKDLLVIVLLPGASTAVYVAFIDTDHYNRDDNTFKLRENLLLPNSQFVVENKVLLFIHVFHYVSLSSLSYTRMYITFSHKLTATITHT